MDNKKKLEGVLENVGLGIITGWVWNAEKPNEPVEVDIYDGNRLLSTVRANIFRRDLMQAGMGNGNHGFIFKYPLRRINGNLHLISVKYSGTDQNISNSPLSTNLLPPNSIEENKQLWENKYDWSKQGDEWSGAWGGTPFMWYGSIYPRIINFIPTKHILEIAPGFGRCTQYLKDLCERLTIVDLSEKCINACKKRFNSQSNIQYFINDGKSLNFLPNNSVDFIFSYDSLVHVESSIIKTYIFGFAKVLKDGGFGFIHHSNLGIYKEKNLPSNIHWRARDMTAKKFEKFCKKAGLQCVTQEIIPWGESSSIDCFSLFTKNANMKIKNRIFENKQFFSQEVNNLHRISSQYNFKKSSSI